GLGHRQPRIRIHLTCKEAGVVTLSSDHEAIFNRLKNDLSVLRPSLDLLDAYYDGAQRFAQLGLALPPEVQEFRVIVNWPRVVADARADRLDPKGFRLPGSDELDTELW